MVEAIAGMVLEGEMRRNSSLFNLRDAEAAAMPANLGAAQQYRNETCFRQKVNGEYRPYSVCSTGLNVIGESGVGVELYFKLVKGLCGLFFIISCISVCPIYYNNRGDGLSAGDIRQRWDTWAVSNTDPVQASSDDHWNKRVQLYLFICDSVCSALFILFIIYFQFVSGQTISKNFEKNVTLADYAIEATGFPENCQERDVREHFSKFGRIHEVFLARRYNGLLNAYREREVLSNEAEYFKLLEKRGNDVKKKLLETQAKLELFDEQIRANEKESVRTHKELPVIKVFIVFEDMVARKECLLQYQRSKRCCRRLKNQPEHLKFQGRFPISARRTAAPSNILYENIEISKCSRFVRRVISLFCVLVALIASIAMVYALKLYQDNLPSAETCASVDSSVSIQQAKAIYTSDTQKYCYCKNNSLTSILNDSETFTYCSYFFERISLNILLRVSVSLGVIMVNFMIKIIFRILSRFERVSNKSLEQLKLMSKVFVATFINTALVILAVNANFSSINTQDWLPKFIFNSDYSDFSREWYVNVGSTLIATMMISVFSPHCFILFTFYPLGLCKRHCCTKRYISQAQANMKFSGADFDLATRNSTLLTIVFTCYLYSGGMPLMNVLCFLSMFLLFWVDKFLILRHYKRPPLYNELLHQRAMTYLPYAVIFHCGFALYMYGATDIFPYHVSDQGPYGTNSVGERLKTLTGFVNIILIIVAATAMCWGILYGKVFACIMKKKVIEVGVLKNAEGTIEKDLESIGAHGLKYYDICLHPEYRDLIKIMNNAAERMKIGKNESRMTEKEP
jgi:hypothetical protein